LERNFFLFLDIEFFFGFEQNFFSFVEDFDMKILTNLSSLFLNYCFFKTFFFVIENKKISITKKAKKKKSKHFFSINKIKIQCQKIANFEETDSKQ
jgi:hypothetical protein